MKELDAADPTGGNPFDTVNWGPSRDEGSAMTEFPADPRELLFSGAIAPNVTVAAGSNTNEGHLFIYPNYPLGLSTKKYEQFVGEFLSNGQDYNATFIAAAIKMYPPHAGDNRDVASRMIGDATFVCGARFAAKAFAEKAPGTSYLYHFALKAADGLTVHAAELPFVFDDYNGTRMMPPARRMAARMGAMWASLARSAVPDPAGEWPKYDLSTDKDILFDKLEAGDDHFTTETGRHAALCDFWATGPIPKLTHTIVR